MYPLPDGGMKCLSLAAHPASMKAQFMAHLHAGIAVNRLQIEDTTLKECTLEGLT
jgi:hypothetical protein